MSEEQLEEYLYLIDFSYIANNEAYDIDVDYLKEDFFKATIYPKNEIFNFLKPIAYIYGSVSTKSDMNTSVKNIGLFITKTQEDIVTREHEVFSIYRFDKDSLFIIKRSVSNDFVLKIDGIEIRKDSNILPPKYMNDITSIIYNVNTGMYSTEEAFLMIKSIYYGYLDIEKNELKLKLRN